jgi:hypothetical protein
MDRTNTHDRDLWNTVGDAASGLRARVEKHPYRTLAVAAGAGYVLAGGLFTRLTARMLKVGVSVAAPLTAWSLLGKTLVDLADALEADGVARSKPVGSRSAPNEAGAAKGGAGLPG